MTMEFDTTRRAFQRQLLCGLGSAAAWPLARATDTSNAPALKVVATFSLLADIAREVGGPAVEVSALVGPNADAHVFEPTPSDVRRVAGADVVITNGLRFEGWIDRLIKASGYRGPVVIASRGVALRQLSGGADPHAWQDLTNGQRYADNIRAALVAALAAKSPAHAAEVEVRASTTSRNSPRSTATPAPASPPCLPSAAASSPPTMPSAISLPPTASPSSRRAAGPPAASRRLKQWPASFDKPGKPKPAH
jgi:hypothetical protein